VSCFPEMMRIVKRCVYRDGEQDGTNGVQWVHSECIVSTVSGVSAVSAVSA
jgi:hypothetical protein